MRYHEIIEAPLPDDWDKRMFDRSTPFKKMVAYAKERAKQVGRGSSRVAFEIPYQGRKTVIKVALNGKGLAQNREEARLLSDGHIASIGIVIPLIDLSDIYSDDSFRYFISSMKSSYVTANTSPETLLNKPVS